MSLSPEIIKRLREKSRQRAEERKEIDKRNREKLGRDPLE